ncbi:uncharacterized protein N7496_012187 [Penicillium cataractarum]|uniref:Uncharacterized protein n=1 Tax=Penicillium cataractarum TaxID=2100454 RepID=A0A9W9R8K7_9EURO|nr:uncharacterized protein N7496_012187 [Penicillium cataractarum]KAJ5354975.1 hypothetical protein N7496_012187 [Penicillium cataractarum]
MVSLPIKKRKKNHFFAQYPDFIHNPLASFSDDFKRLALERNWSYGSKTWKQKWVLCTKAEYQDLIGTDLTNFEKWQTICFKLDIRGVYSIRQAKKALSQVHINLIDLLETWDAYRGPKKFSSTRELAHYSVSTSKIYPREAAKVDPALRVLLKHLM